MSTLRAVSASTPQFSVHVNVAVARLTVVMLDI